MEAGGGTIPHRIVTSQPPKFFTNTSKNSSHFDNQFAALDNKNREIQ
jgi:hypothetical protein